MCRGERRDRDPRLYRPNNLAPWKKNSEIMILGNIFQGSQLLPLAKSFGNITSTGLQQVQHFFPIP